jgi:hypothetical protein
MPARGNPQARGTAMPNTTIPSTTIPSTPDSPAPRFFRMLAVAVALLLLAGPLALWAHYGTAVFYETILAGIAACF